MNCGWCKKTDDKLSVCKGCLEQFYCSVECQREHWSEHKKICKSKKKQEWRAVCYCGAPAVQYCKRCELAFYCSNDCQTKHQQGRVKVYGTETMLEPHSTHDVCLYLKPANYALKCMKFPTFPKFDVFSETGNVESAENLQEFIKETYDNFMGAVARMQRLDGNTNNIMVFVQLGMDADIMVYLGVLYLHVQGCCDKNCRVPRCVDLRKELDDGTQPKQLTDVFVRRGYLVWAEHNLARS